MLFNIAAQLGAYLRWANPWEGHSDDPLEKSPAQDVRLKLHCLGSFRVELDGEAIPLDRFHRVKTVTLLKFLAAHRGRPVHREALMDLLWPDMDPARAASNLRVVLHALRRGLEPGLERRQESSYIVSQGDLVYLEASGRIWVDEEEFVMRARRAAELVSQDLLEQAISEYDKAASLYHGEYLEDEPYSDWCLFERERLKEVYISLMDQMASVLAETGDAARAIDACRTVLGVELGREEIHRKLMLLLWKAGRRDEALRQYEICSSVLIEELGVEPAQETTALRNAILAELQP